MAAGWERFDELDHGQARRIRVYWQDAGTSAEPYLYAVTEFDIQGRQTRQQRFFPNGALLFYKLTQYVSADVEITVEWSELEQRALEQWTVQYDMTRRIKQIRYQSFLSGQEWQTVIAQDERGRDVSLRHVTLGMPESEFRCAFRYEADVRRERYTRSSDGALLGESEFRETQDPQEIDERGNWVRATAYKRDGMGWAPRSIVSREIEYADTLT